MIAISKDEKKIISKKFPNVHIVRTMKQMSKRHHYYCEENRAVMNLIRKMRGGKQFSAPNTRGDKNTVNTNGARV